VQRAGCGRHDRFHSVLGAVCPQGTRAHRAARRLPSVRPLHHSLRVAGAGDDLGADPRLRAAHGCSRRRIFTRSPTAPAVQSDRSEAASASADMTSQEGAGVAKGGNNSDNTHAPPGGDGSDWRMTPPAGCRGRAWPWPSRGRMRVSPRYWCSSGNRRRGHAIATISRSLGVE
jgi:hypothetical protein